MSGQVWALGLSALSIAGAILNVRRRRSGFAVWMVANAGWIVHSVAFGNWGQIPVWAVFLGVTIWGWFEWGGKCGVRNAECGSKKGEGSRK